ncbi:hypothetical protein MRX96_045387 [Rhipicephalus microplus]
MKNRDKSQLYLAYLDLQQAYDSVPHSRLGDRESALLFQARTGSLPTRKRHWELFDTDPSCRLCGATEETIQHILMDCPRLGARDLPKINLAEYLGLPDDPVDTRSRTHRECQATSKTLGQTVLAGGQTPRQCPAQRRADRKYLNDADATG